MEHFQLSTLNSQLVRSDPELMAFYIATFEQTFGYKPNCVGCSFNSDFQRLKNKLKSSLNPCEGGTSELKTKNNMKSFSTLNSQLSTKKQPKAPTFILRQKKGEILSYRKDEYTFRCYDYNLTQEFVTGFLTYGTAEELKEREKLFSKIPSVLTQEQPTENKAGKEVKNTETTTKTEEKQNFSTKKHKK